MCYSIAPCGTCDTCKEIASMPPWTPEPTPELCRLSEDGTRYIHLAPRTSKTPGGAHVLDCDACGIHIVD